MILNTSLVPDTFSISKVNIHEIEYDKVTPNNITLLFPENTTVTDAIKGISYKTDANGEAIESTIEPLYGLDPSQVKLPEPPKRNINIIFIVAGIVLIVTALYLQFKKRRK
ncbi:MAG: LPXTG cell wall anchor domain-containing protein [Planctomycetaceae bacterium]|nr:LPXTG cell wall anchor domain-containing protein [Planctomycetaceae bacterium]